MNEREIQLLARVRELEKRLAEPAKFGAAVFDEPAPPVDLPAVPADAPEPWAGPTRSSFELAGSFFILAAFVALYRAIIAADLGRTSLMFLGLPAFVGAALALTPAPGSMTGRAARLMTMVLAVSAILLQEGSICVLMAAPLYYIVGLTIAWLIDQGRKNQGRAPANAGLALLMLASAEGTTPVLDLPREDVVTATAVVEGTPDEVRRAVAATTVFDTPLPPFLRLRFPRPVFARGDGIRPGSTRIIGFDAGMGRPGELYLRVASSSDTHCVFVAERDTTPIANWLTWRRSEVRWRAVDPDHVEVTWQIAYRRELAPGIYFGLWERYAMELAAGWLIETVATP